MPDLDALLLARIQFAFTVSFHFIFPAFSIGLASYLAVLEALWLKTNGRGSTYSTIGTSTSVATPSTDKTAL